MTKKLGKTIALESGFLKPDVGDVIKVEAVDWGYEGEQMSARSSFAIVYGTVYGKVIICNDDQITLAFQVFHGGDVRSVLSIPWVTISRVVILEKGDAK